MSQKIHLLAILLMGRDRYLATLAYEAVLTKFTAPVNVSSSYRVLYDLSIVSVARVHVTVGQIRQHRVCRTFDFRFLSPVFH